MSTQLAHQSPTPAATLQPSTKPRITVIVPTLCEAKRGSVLRRAIASARSASSEAVAILVVVNGDRFDSELLASLRSDEKISVLQLTIASVTEAQLAGRRAVKSEYFTFLDDDDEFLPQALDLRMQLLTDCTDCAVAVTEGLRNTNGADAPLFADLSDVPADPLGAILQRGWLHSGNNLFRTSEIPVGFFEESQVHGEWTWLAFRLAMAGKKIAATNQATFRYYDTPESLSKSIDHTRAYIRLFGQMLNAAPPPAYRSRIRSRLAGAHHDYSVLLMSKGDRTGAFKHHLLSIIYPRGWRFLPYTRHLLRACIGKAVTA